jgi:hypothetical protein
MLDPHVFPRRVRPSPFRLNHFWIDLRHCVFFEVPSIAKKGQEKKKRMKPARKKKDTRNSGKKQL